MGRTLRAGAALALCLLICLLPSGCASKADGLRDGYYTAEAAEFDAYGWKEFVILCVSDHRVVSVDYDAKNASGLIKSWDMDYMRLMNEVDGTYPNEYTRLYSQALLGANRLEDCAVDAISGATTSYHTFMKLAEAAFAQARTGDSAVVFVSFD